MPARPIERVFQGTGFDGSGAGPIAQPLVVVVVDVAWFVDPPSSDGAGVVFTLPASFVGAPASFLAGPPLFGHAGGAVYTVQSGVGFGYFVQFADAVTALCTMKSRHASRRV